MNSILDESNFYDFTDTLRNRGRYMKNLGQTMEAFSQELYPTNVSNIKDHFDMVSSNNSELSLLSEKLNEIERRPYSGYESVPMIFSIKLKESERGGLRSKCWAESLSWISWDLSVIDRGDYHSDFTYFVTQTIPFTYSPEKVRMITTPFEAFGGKSVAEQVSNLDVARIYGHATPDKKSQFVFTSISEVNDFFGKIYEEIMKVDLLILKAERFVKISDLGETDGVIKLGVDPAINDAISWTSYSLPTWTSIAANGGTAVSWSIPEIDELKQQVEDLKKQLLEKNKEEP